MPVLPAGVAGIASEGANIAALAGGAPAAALKLFTDGLEGATADMVKFVEALSPATVAVFNKAMADLFATVGEALLPALEVFTEVINRVADVIAPLMQQLAPILKVLADILGTFLVGAVDAVVGVFMALASVFGGLDGAVKSLRQQVQDFVRVLIGGIAYLIKAFGGADVIRQWAQAVGAVGTRAVAAPQAATVKGLADIANTMATSAFTAAGVSEGADEMLDFQKKMADYLKAIADNDRTFIDWFMKEFVRELVKAMTNLPVTLLKTFGAGQINAAMDWTRENINRNIGYSAEMEKSVAEWIDRKLA